MNIDASTASIVATTTTTTTTTTKADETPDKATCSLSSGATKILIDDPTNTKSPFHSPNAADAREDTNESEREEPAE